MKNLLLAILFFFCLILGLIVLIDIVWFIVYMVFQIIEKKDRNSVIVKAESMNDAHIMEAVNKSSLDACRDIEPVLLFWEQPDEDFPCMVGVNLNAKIKCSKKLLNHNGVFKRLRFFDVSAERNKSGSVYRKWDNGGKEWRACELYGTMVEDYRSVADGRLISRNYYPKVRLTYSMSRKLINEDKKRAVTKDKWGRKNEIKSFYSGMNLTQCPSCGAELPADLKDTVCPYCDSTIFADYYDWQVEALEIIPQSSRFVGIIETTIDIFSYKPIADNVKNKNKKDKIVRFSENDLRNDIYEDCLKADKSDKLIDLCLGTVQIRRVINTDDETELKISAPIYKAFLDENNEIVSKTEMLKASYKRPRYPNRFNAKNAVISAEKKCPSCGGGFSPDKKGCCKFCGEFLFIDQLKWNRVE